MYFPSPSHFWGLEVLCISAATIKNICEWFEVISTTSNNSQIFLYGDLYVLYGEVNIFPGLVIDVRNKPTSEKHSRNSFAPWQAATLN